MALRLNGATSGFVELNAPDEAGSNTLTLPDGNGTSGQYLQTDGSGGLSWATVTDTNTNLTRLTNVSDPGTATVDFTSIPSDAKRITIVFDSVTRSSTGRYMVQIGDEDGIVTSGYQAACGYMFYNNTASADGNATTKTGFEMQHSSAAQETGMVTLFNPTGNVWVAAGTQVGGSTSNWSAFVNGGRRELSKTLTQVRFTTVAGTATLNGNFNVFYEV
jgi:hypothetical protein